MKSYSSMWVHLIWTTKDRNPLLHKNFRVALFKYVKGNAQQKGMIVDTINGIEDHVHCLVRLKTSQSIAQIVKQLKGSSSRWISSKNVIGIPFSWQVGYGAISVSPSEINAVRQYIIQQEKHHATWKLDQEITQFERYNNF
ncbi:IS200/IS605 family transposase [Fodinibius sp.]|uniref:IS200/IS605 family transposase n=1 Tax=Fodinibius sp. TaxID=1872440 RepID=UPI002ACD2D77|nr:IS200/IS605 family transposase [Fodinibius sp.]MDZ7658159.1 IS200/IS605 family transposase [Fodinibius sp.]